VAAIAFSVKPLPFDPTKQRRRTEFVALGKAEGGGCCGWVLLTWVPRDKRPTNCRPHDDPGQRRAGPRARHVRDPDHLDYSAKGRRLVEVFMQAIRWPNADSLYAAD
jgi:superoxide dismutase, Fe-Mn family